MVTVLNGLVSGFVATGVMTIFMLGLGDDSPPPTAALWAKFVGEQGPEAYMPQGMALHMLYGIGAGGAFAVMASTADLGVGTLTGGVLWGVGYAVVLTVVGMVFWMKIVLAMNPEPKPVAMFGVFHLVYGLVLGSGAVLVPL
jgi:hypothetical protein